MERIYDSNGVEVKAGDVVHFSYGIPPIGVDGSIVDEDGVLYILTPGHNPEKTELVDFADYIVDFYINDTD